jgi:microcystin-dependent protein
MTIRDKNEGFMKFLFLLLIPTLVQAQAQRSFEKFLPLGSIVEVAGNCPSGFLQNNGQAVSRTTYSNLFSQIGTSYGAGNGTTTFNLPNSDWQIDANIGGANPALTNSALSSYTEITDAGLDMVLRSYSATAEIGCSGTNPPTGLTCAAGSESIAVAFTPPSSGLFEVCFEHSQFTAGAGGAIVTFQTIETPINAQTITSEGGSRVNQAYSVSAVDDRFKTDTCGTHQFSDVSKKMVRLMREQTIASTPSIHALIADRLAASGQRDVRVTVRPLKKIGNCIKY